MFIYICNVYKGVFLLHVQVLPKTLVTYILRLKSLLTTSSAV